MLSSIKAHINIIVLVISCLAFVVLYAIPIATTGVDNLRLIEAINVDEAYFLRYVRTALDRQSFGLIMHNYGYFYFYLGLAPLMLIDLISPVSDGLIVVTFRLISSLFFIGTVLLTYQFGKYVFNDRVALLSALLVLLGSQVLVHSAVEFHPDTAQMFFVLLAFYSCYRFYIQGLVRQLLWASVWAGVAYSCKFSGILLMPFVFGVFLLQGKRFAKITQRFLWLILLYQVFLLAVVNPIQLQDYLHQELSGNVILIGLWVLFILTSIYLPYRLWLLIKSKAALGNKFTERVDMLYLLALLFWASFTLTSPGAVYHFEFIESFQKVVGLAQQSGVRLEAMNNGKLLWLNNLLSVDFLSGWILPLAALLSLPWVLGKNRKFIKTIYPIWLWVGLFLGVLSVSIKANYTFYLLPILPFMALLAVYFLESIVTEISPRFPAIAMLSIILGCSFLIALVGMRKSQYQEKMLEYKSPFIKIGDVIKRNVPVNESVLADYYSYVPPEYKYVEYTWGIRQDQIINQPNWIVVNSKIKNRYDLAQDSISLSIKNIYANLASNYQLIESIGERQNVLLYKKR